MLVGTRILSRHDVATLLSLDECIGAVEQAFVDHALGRALPPGVLGIHAPGGGFHIKAAGFAGEAGAFVTKINGNFAANPDRFGLPRIQGAAVLSDVRSGYPLAVMDSAELTVLRTAAATGVAARHLARPDATVATIIGCGRQAAAQLRAVALVRPLERAWAIDIDAGRARNFARDMTAQLRFPVESAGDLEAATSRSGIVLTCTSAERIVLRSGDVRPGTFIAAVGADSDTKQEIAPELMAEAAVVPDLLEQAATIGDLHHAIAAGLMTRESARGELGAVIAGLAPGRCQGNEIVVFDSTGTALQDVAAAQLVLQRAELAGRGVVLDIAGNGTAPAKAPGPLRFLDRGVRF